MSVFDTLNDINVNERLEEKGGKTKLKYLSWVWAWGELKKKYPDSYCTVYENPDGWNYFTDGKTCWVKTGVTVVDGDWKQECIEYLPVMDYNNHSIPVDRVTSFDVTKAIQRSITKAIARHGLGLYVYAGEDLPTNDSPQSEAQPDEQPKPAEQPKPVEQPKPIPNGYCEGCKKEIKPVTIKGKEYSVANIIKVSQKEFGKNLCFDCVQYERKRKAAKDKLNEN